MKSSFPQDVLQRFIDITDDSETYTAVTALMTREEGRKLAMCVGQQFHYVQCGTNWLRISNIASRVVIEIMVLVAEITKFIETKRKICA